MILAADYPFLDILWSMIIFFAWVIWIFMVFTILGDAKPASGWPAGATGAMGAITPIESGYYTQKLVRVDGQWLIESLQVRHNLPFAF